MCGRYNIIDDPFVQDQLGSLEIALAADDET
jgi:hypothetical protein